MNADAGRLAALARLFSAGAVREMARRGRSGLVRRLLRQSGLAETCPPDATVGDAFDAAFDALDVAGQRTEYVCRAAILRAVRPAAMTAEFRTRTSKADLVVLDKTATAWEIKSDRDSLARLPGQVADYRRVFGQVAVLVGESRVEAALARVPDGVGVSCLTDGGRIDTARAAADRADLTDPVAVFEALRLPEAIAILKSLDIPAPKVPNTQRHAALAALFAGVDPVDLQARMARTLKSTRSLAPLRQLADAMPRSLRTAALSVPLRRGDHGALVAAVRAPLATALTWR